MCVLCILGVVVSSFTLHCCGEVQSDRSCPNAKGNNCKTPGLLTSKRSHNVSRYKIKKKLNKNCIYQKYPIYQLYISAIYIKPILCDVKEKTNMLELEWGHWHGTATLWMYTTYSSELVVRDTVVTDICCMSRSSFYGNRQTSLSESELWQLHFSDIYGHWACAPHILQAE